MSQITIQPNHKAIEAYYSTRAALDAQGVKTEGNLRRAFGGLLADTARLRNWTLVEEFSIKREGYKLIRLDGVLRDKYKFRYGYWEAKDSQDDLAKEIINKQMKGYPTSNIIFEDTQQAVLIQNKIEIFRADLNQAKQVARLLSLFYSYNKPDRDAFEQAVEQFKGHIPELAQGLVVLIKDAHKNNQGFITAYDRFFELCRESLNPSISRAAVDEMLIQHIMTSRLIENVFRTDFTRRNIIAAEVETLINTLTEQHFSRKEYFRPVEHFYTSIENAALNTDDFSEKQDFINTVYENFFQGYSVKVADTHGIVYTPPEIVDFMCAAVEEVLETDFDQKLYDKGVYILDPCTGTGNFIINLLNRVPPSHLKAFYQEQLFANEVMLLPYYVAALNIEHEYYRLAEVYESFSGLSFVDTLDIAEKHRQPSLFQFNDKNTERVRHQKQTPITVIIGNPPYNIGQLNENDNNKNRAYPEVDKRVRDTYAKDSTATLKNKLYDAYVKFFRWATDRLENRDGIICYVTNNSFVDQIAFDGMRKHLLQDFTRVYHVDLHGNVRQNPKLSGTTHNVFGIQVGVGITVAVRSEKHKDQGCKLFYYRLPEFWHKKEKLDWLAEHVEQKGRQNALNMIEWQELTPDTKNTWLVPDHADQFAAFIPLGTKETKSTETIVSGAIFKIYSSGVVTSRDDWVYSFRDNDLVSAMRTFVYNYNYEVFRFSQESVMPDSIDDFVNNDPKFLKWTDRLKTTLQAKQTLQFEPSQIRQSLYRPFTKKFLYFDSLLNQRRYQQHRIFPTPTVEAENRVICVSGVGSSKPPQALMVDMIPCFDVLEKTQSFPFYVYAEDGSERWENITDWALEQFQAQYEDADITKWDIFYYVYGLLHHPEYRTRYADNLKRELPRLPFAPDFWAFSRAGKALADLHLTYEQAAEYKLEWVENGVLDWRTEKMHLTRDKTELTYNNWLKLVGIPPETYEYRLGNRSALEWVIDQYQVKQHKAGISDPNRADDPQYITRLLGQVITVSLETVQIVNALPRLG